MSPPALSVTHSASSMGSIAALSTPSRRYPTTLQTQWEKEKGKREGMEEHVSMCEKGTRKRWDRGTMKEHSMSIGGTKGNTKGFEDTSDVTAVPNSSVQSRQTQLGAVHSRAVLQNAHLSYTTSCSTPCHCPFKRSRCLTTSAAASSSLAPVAPWPRALDASSERFQKSE